MAFGIRGVWAVGVSRYEYELVCGESVPVALIVLGVGRRLGLRSSGGCAGVALRW